MSEIWDNFSEWYLGIWEDVKSIENSFLCGLAIILFVVISFAIAMIILGVYLMLIKWIFGIESDILTAVVSFGIIFLIVIITSLGRAVKK